MASAHRFESLGALDWSALLCAHIYMYAQTRQANTILQYKELGAIRNRNRPNQRRETQNNFVAIASALTAIYSENVSFFVFHIFFISILRQRFERNCLRPIERYRTLSRDLVSILLYSLKG